jgi:6-phosphogluconate dehydrogenase
MMPGGSKAAWEHVKPIFQAICAKVENGSPCCDWVGDEGSGHFVKMVHNGIEYGDMQLICEAYHIMRDVLGLSNEELYKVFNSWNEGDLDSYLIEITRDILAKKDEQDKYVVDQILDTAGQKGTGKWTVMSAADMGIPLTMVAEAVFARCLSAAKEERMAASKLFNGPQIKWTGDKQAFINAIRDSVFATKLMSYTQGYLLMREAAKTFNWSLNYGGIALMWRGGCIIRSKFLGKIKEAFDKNPNLQNLLFDPYFKEKINQCQKGWREVVSSSVLHGIPLPGISAALAYYDGLRTEKLPANLLQAQRDYFGAHTYEKIDQPRGKFFHTNWTGKGGTTSSSSYNA